MDLAKRNALIARYLATGGVTPASALTDDDRLAIDEARALGLRTPTDAVATAPDGGLEIELGPLMELFDRFHHLHANFGYVFGEPERFARMDPTDAFAEIVARTRAAERAAISTIDVRAFFDGNEDTRCFGNATANFATIRQTLLNLAARPEVLGVGVSVNELPNIDIAADDDMWIEAEEVYVWTREKVRVLREWLSPIQPQWVAKVALRSVAPPEPRKFPPKTIAARAGWD